MQSFPHVSLRRLSVTAPWRAIVSRRVAKAQSAIRKAIITAISLPKLLCALFPSVVNIASRRDSLTCDLSCKVFLMFLCADLASLRLGEQLFHAEPQKRKVQFAKPKLQRLSLPKLLCALFPSVVNIASRRDSLTCDLSCKVFLMFLCADLASMHLGVQLFHAEPQKRKVQFAVTLLSQTPLCAQRPPW